MTLPYSPFEGFHRPPRFLSYSREAPNSFLCRHHIGVIESWVVQRHISVDPIQEFFYHWPKNFCIAFWIEMLLAQPIARFVMKTMHVKQAAKAAQLDNVEA